MKEFLKNLQKASAGSSSDEYQSGDEYQTAYVKLPDHSQDELTQADSQLARALPLLGKTVFYETEFVASSEELALELVSGVSQDLSKFVEISNSVGLTGIEKSLVNDEATIQNSISNISVVRSYWDDTAFKVSFDVASDTRGNAEDFSDSLVNAVFDRANVSIADASVEDTSFLLDHVGERIVMRFETSTRLSDAQLTADTRNYEKLLFGAAQFAEASESIAVEPAVIKMCTEWREDALVKRAKTQELWRLWYESKNKKNGKEIN